MQNVVQQYLNEAQADYKAGVDLYLRFGDNEGLKDVLRKGYAPFNLSAALRKGLQAIAKMPHIPQHLPKPEQSARKVVVAAVRSEESKRFEAETALAHFERNLREVDGTVAEINRQIDELLAIRGDKATELTDITLPDGLCRSLVQDCRLITEQVAELIQRRKRYIETGCDQPAAAEDGADPIDSADTLEDLNRQLKLARSRRSKAMKKAEQRPSKKKYYQDRAGMEDVRINRIQAKISALK